MPKFDFNKVASHIFRTPFLKNTSGLLLLLCDTSDIYIFEIYEDLRCKFCKIYICTNLNRREWGVGGVMFTLPFFKNLKKVLYFREKNALIVVIYGLNFSILKSLHKKKLEIFTCGTFLSLFAHDCESKCPNSMKNPLY